MRTFPWIFIFLLFHTVRGAESLIPNTTSGIVTDEAFFRKWPFSGEDDRGKTSPHALVFTRCDIQSERL
jgi:hypothetical protein